MDRCGGMMKILMIDDDEELCEMTQEFFALADVSMDYCINGNLWPVLMKKNHYDAIILDLSLPETSGLVILKKLKDSGDVPVMMLTAQGSDLDHISSLEIGADDYVDKPCNPKVLLHRIKKMVSNRQNIKLAQHQDIHIGPLQVLHGSKQVFIDGKLLKLTVSEFKIMDFLASNLDKVLSKMEICVAVLGRKPDEYDRSVDAHIFKLRRKLDSIPKIKVIIETVYGHGYKMIIHD